MVLLGRRSIGKFEKWLDEEILRGQDELTRLATEVEKLQHQHSEQSVRVDTLQSVKDKLTPASTGDFNTLPLAESMDGEDDHVDA